MLLKLYSLYERSPKKCRQLEDIVADLKESLDPTELPQKGGNHPLRTNGTCFVAHKVKALERMIDRYGAYLGHLKALTLDASVKSVDQEKIKGYLNSGGKVKCYSVVLFLLMCLTCIYFV